MVFNRPDTTRKVFEAIRQARPTHLYIACDGPRANIESDYQTVKQVQNIVSNINWPCTVERLYRDRNLGCKLAISTAIDWFFEFEKEGIILEDDCLPSNQFFDYAAVMLERYRDNPKISFISGTNYFGDNDITNKYFYTTFGSIWGWATWRRSWKSYSLDSKQLNFGDFNTSITNFKLITKLYLRLCFKLVFDVGINTWDHQLTFVTITNKQLTVVPAANLISNIGIVGTHSKSGDVRNSLPFGNLSISKLEPTAEVIAENSEYERMLVKHLLIFLTLRGYVSYLKRLIRK